MNKKFGFTLAEGATHRGRGKYKKMAFTLAESATHTNMLQRVGNGFTLAEILITLAIIGVVAAMTIPTLIAKINEKVTENQKKVFEAKVLKGLNLTRTAGELNNTYSSTEDFLRNGLGKHLKMAKICDASHTRDCVPYDSILYTTSDNKEDSVDVKDINTAEELGKTEDEGFKDIASFVMGDGTVVIATYKLDCLVDEGKLDRDIGENPCIAGIYDLNGTRKPNKMGEDLLTFNATLNIKKGPAVLATIGGVKLISNAAVPTPMTKAECEENKSKYGINECYYDPDYWAGAMKTCKDSGGRLPTNAELTSIATALYGGKQGGGSFTETYNIEYGAGNIGSGEAIPSSLSGLDSSGYTLWSSSENAAENACGRDFYSSETFMGDYERDNFGTRAVCVAD